MIRILFICYGNICRSVGAQFIMQEFVNQRKMANRFYISSAATSDENTGDTIYPPMKKALEKKDIPIGEHYARQLQRSDYENYDLIIGMDTQNLLAMHQILGIDTKGKIHLLMEYTDKPDRKIADPWYTRQFDECTDELIEGCEGLLKGLV